MRYLIFSFTVVTLLSVGQSRGEDVTKKTVYKTPQAVFDAMKKATTKYDLKSFADLLSEDSLERATAQMVQGSLIARPMGIGGAPKDKVVPEAVRAMMEKHGISRKVQKDLEAAFKKGRDEIAKLAEKVVKKSVKDKKALLIGLTEIRDKTRGRLGSSPPDYQLVDLTVTGKTAKGTILAEFEGRPLRQPIEFKKEGASWKLHMPERK